MDKEYKNRSGSQSNRSGKNENTGDKRRSNLPGAPGTSNRQTGGNDRNDRDDVTKGPEHNTAKKGENPV